MWSVRGRAVCGGRRGVGLGRAPHHAAPGGAEALGSAFRRRKDEGSPGAQAVTLGEVSYTHTRMHTHRHTHVHTDRHTHVHSQTHADSTAGTRFSPHRVATFQVGPHRGLWAAGESGLPSLTPGPPPPWLLEQPASWVPGGVVFTSVNIGCGRPAL